MNTCSQCGRQDNPIVEMVPNQDNSAIIERITHFVRPEIQYLKAGESVTPRQTRQGWIQRIFQGRQAIERSICMDCLNTNYIRRQLNAEQRKKALALEKDKNGEENFYLLLADVDGAY